MGPRACSDVANLRRAVTRISWSQVVREFGDRTHDGGAHAGGQASDGEGVGLGVVGSDDIAVGHGDGERVDVEHVVAGPGAGSVAVPVGLEHGGHVGSGHGPGQRAGGGRVALRESVEHALLPVGVGEVLPGADHVEVR